MTGSWPSARPERAQLTFPDWMQAYDTCYRAPARLASESVALDRALGRILAAELKARSDVPHYVSSAMDGWAVRGAAPWREVGTERLQPGEARVIATGGLIPPGASGVLRREHGSVHVVGGERLLDRNALAAAGEPSAGQHIRPAGEEARAGDVLIRAQSRLNPAHLAVAAMAGHDRLDLLRRPRVGLIYTGDEVVEAGVPAPGFVRDTFGPGLPGFVTALGGAPGVGRRVPDDAKIVAATIAELASASELIVTTGGTGASDADHVRGALSSLGARILIDGVAMRPGGPSVVAELAGDRLLVALAGNPLAAMIGMLTLVRPILAGFQGAPSPALGRIALAVSLPATAGRSALMPYQLVEGVAVPSRWRGSGMLRGLAEADGVLAVPPAGAAAGDSVTTLPLPW